MFTMAQKLRPHPDVVETELEGEETVLLHLHSKLYYSLNITGTRIWRGLKRGVTLQEISRHLQEEFAVDSELADQGVLALVAELRLQQLLEQPAQADDFSDRSSED